MLVLICGIIGFISCLIISRDDLSDDFGLYIVMSLVVGAILAMLGVILTMIVHASSPKIYTTYEKPIVSMYNDQQISGSFFLGSGTIDETEYYFCMEKIEENRYKRLQVPAKHTIICESDTESPKYKYTIEKSVYEKFLVLDFSDISNRELVVPKNTIIKQFSIK